MISDFINWASEANPTLGCSIEILGDIYICRYVSYFKLTAKAESRGPNTRMLKVKFWTDL